MQPAAAVWLLVLLAAGSAALPLTTLDSTVVTWSSARTFEAARATIASAQEHGAHAIVLYDAGITQQQRIEASDWESVRVQRLRGPLADRWRASGPIGAGTAFTCALEGAVVEHASARFGRHTVLAPGTLLTAPLRYAEDMLLPAGHYFLGDERAARMGRDHCEEGRDAAPAAYCVGPVQIFVPGSEAARECAEYRRLLAEGRSDVRFAHRCFLQSCLPRDTLADPAAMRAYSDWFDASRAVEEWPAGSAPAPRPARSLALVLAFDAETAADAARAVVAWRGPRGLPCRAGERFGPPADLLVADLSPLPSPHSLRPVAEALAGDAAADPATPPSALPLAPHLARCFRSASLFALNGSRADYCERVRANMSEGPEDPYGSFGGAGRLAPELCDLLLQLLSSAPLRARHGHAFLWDPATAAVRAGWLDELRRLPLVAPLAWVHGSLDRSPPPAQAAPKPEAKPPWWRALAATALYAMDAGLAELAARVAREHGGAEPLNAALAAFMEDTDYKALQRHMHRFRPAEFLVHLGRAAWSADAARELYPDAYIVHGPGQAFP